MSLTLSVLPGEYAVSQLPADTLPANALPPAWAMQGEFWTVSRTPEELSLVCASQFVPDGIRAQKGWAALKLHGPFEFTLTGILASVLNPLRDASIGIFALSTFDTDYVLVSQEKLQAAVKALEAAGHKVVHPSEADGN